MINHDSLAITTRQVKAPRSVLFGLRGEERFDQAGKRKTLSFSPLIITASKTGTLRVDGSRHLDSACFFPPIDGVKFVALNFAVSF